MVLVGVEGSVLVGVGGEGGRPAAFVAAGEVLYKARVWALELAVFSGAREVGSGGGKQTYRSGG
jgi:hypothetical protein